MSWSTSELRVRLAPLNRFKPSSKIFYWPFQGGTSFVDLLCFCSVLCLLCLCARLFICALWSPAGKGLTSWLCLGCLLWVCHFPIGILGPFLTLTRSKLRQTEDHYWFEHIVQGPHPLCYIQWRVWKNVPSPTLRSLHEFAQYRGYIEKKNENAYRLCIQESLVYYRSIKKIISLRNISKVFSHFLH